MSDLVKELLIFVGIFVIIVAATIAVRSGGRKNNEVNDPRNDAGRPDTSHENSNGKKNK
jgi:hypothetical protein